MDRAAKEEMIRLLEEKGRRRATRRLFSYYPESGPLRRELYVKHTQFFHAGNSFRERLMLAANRVGKCVSGDTLIESPHGPSQRVMDIKGDHWVWAWDGDKKVPAKAEQPFTKPAEMIYRVWLESGQFLDCAAEHRFLTEVGWIFLSDLFESLPSLPRSTSDKGPASSIEDVRRWMKTLPSFPVDCRQAHHLSGEQLRAEAKNVRSFFLRLVDVLKRSPASLRMGDWVRKGTHTLLQFFAHLSSKDEEGHLVGHSAESIVGVPGIAEQWCLGSLQGFWPLSTEAVAQLQQDVLIRGRSNSYIPALITPDGSHSSVICYQAIGVQPVWDFHVPVYRNYCTAGIIHHNTEGVGGFETAVHLTGLYPKWWTGRRFNKPIDAWAAGDTSKTVRDIIQFKLLGPLHQKGTGLIPQDSIVKTTMKQGVSDAVDTIYVKHASGGVSQIGLKSYDQKRESFQGTEKDLIWLDEEPPLEIYIECLLRTMTNDGIVMATFTPLMGMSDTVMQFLPGGQVVERNDGTKFVVMATWDDAPHLSVQMKEELWKSIPPFQRDARSKGVPQLGSGAIYPVPESDIVTADFEIPLHWPRAYAMDVGWNRTACLWGALNRETDVLYLYSEHYRGQAEPSIHAEAIKARGDWMTGVIDPAARGRAQADGRQLLQDYIDLGLNLEIAFNGVESGIYEVWQRLSTGRLKVFQSLQNWLFEFRLYRRDEKGRIVKAHDHLMDVTRYLVMSGLEAMKTKPGKPDQKEPLYVTGSNTTGWMG